MVGSYYLANKQGDGTIPPMSRSPAVVSGLALHNVDGMPIMGGRLVPGDGGGGVGAISGYGITSMSGGAANAKCAAFPLWFSSNIQYSIGGIKTTTNWMPFVNQPGI